MSNSRVKEWSGTIFDFTIAMDDGTQVETRNSLGDVVRWEKNRKERWGSGPVGVEGLLYLAWLAGRRNGGVITERHFENWVNHVVDLDAERITYETDSSADQDNDLGDEVGPGWADPTHSAGPADG